MDDTSQEPSLAGQRDLVERVAAVLVRAGLFSVAGELYEKVRAWHHCCCDC